MMRVQSITSQNSGLTDLYNKIQDSEYSTSYNSGNSCKINNCITANIDFFCVIYTPYCGHLKQLDKKSKTTYTMFLGCMYL